MIAILDKNPTTYQGQFGEFTIDQRDRREVLIYRGGLVLAALSFAIGANLFVAQGEAALPWITPLFALFSLSLGVSLYFIHIYMVALHRALQAFWVIGSISAIAIAFYRPPRHGADLFQDVRRRHIRDGTAMN